MRWSRSYDYLIQRAQQADEYERRQLLDELVPQFTAVALQWALVVLQDEATAYDAVQEAWLNAFLHLDQLRESAAFPAWFHRIVLTSCYRTIRREKTANWSPDL